MDYVAHVLAAGPLVIVLIAIAAALLAVFAWFFVVRGTALWWQLWRLGRDLGSLGDEPRPTLRAKLTTAFKRTRCFHAWSEYEETLHDQYVLQGGERRVQDVRATVPAEGFLNPEAIIDPRTGAEFIKHLPGIFTGLGIVGTFYGLIKGLMAFKPDVDAEALKASLGGLFAHVMDAFIFSMTAIGIAMLVTLVEKWIYAGCVKRLGQVANNLDSLFRSGLGEEYLADLVHASQDNATQTRQLKESLVQDLKELLVQLTERQIAATQQLSNDQVAATQQLSSNLARQLEESLKEPLASIAETVRQASGQQSDAVRGTLESLMRVFIDKMQETLGGQMTGLNEMMLASTQSMGRVEVSLRTLVADMQRVSGESTSGMQQAVQELIERMSEHQLQQAERVAASNDSLVAQVGSALGGIVQQQDAMRRQSEDALSGLATAMHDRVAQLADSNRETQEQSAALARTLSDVSTEAIAGMGQSAAAMDGVLKGVEQATANLRALVEKMTALQTVFGASAKQISESSVVLGGATQSLSTAAGSVGTATARLESFGKVVQSESDARNAMLRDLAQLTGQAKSTGESLVSLTDEVRKKLDESLEKFGTGITGVLGRNLTEYNKQLSDAVGMLRAAMEEMAEKAESGG